MTDENEKTDKQNTWLRILIIFLFVCIYSVAEVVIAGIVLLQIFFNIFTGRSNENLLRFGKDLSEYIYQLFLYITYNTDVRPFPFEEWGDTVHRRDKESR